MIDVNYQNLPKKYKSLYALAQRLVIDKPIAIK